MLIEDKNGQELPPGVTGEIWLRSPTTAHGYWKLPEVCSLLLGNFDGSADFDLDRIGNGIILDS